MRGESEMGLGICRVGSGNAGGFENEKGDYVCGSRARRCMEHGVLVRNIVLGVHFRV